MQDLNFCLTDLHWTRKAQGLGERLGAGEVMGLSGGPGLWGVGVGTGLFQISPQHQPARGARPSWGPAQVLPSWVPAMLSYPLSLGCGSSPVYKLEGNAASPAHRTLRKPHPSCSCNQGLDLHPRVLSSCEVRCLQLPYSCLWMAGEMRQSLDPYLEVGGWEFSFHSVEKRITTRGDETNLSQWGQKASWSTVSTQWAGALG